MSSIYNGMSIGGQHTNATQCATMVISHDDGATKTLIANGGLQFIQRGRLPVCLTCSNSSSLYVKASVLIVLCSNNPRRSSGAK